MYCANNCADIIMLNEKVWNFVSLVPSIAFFLSEIFSREFL